MKRKYTLLNGHTYYMDAEKLIDNLYEKQKYYLEGKEEFHRFWDILVGDWVYWDEFWDLCKELNNKDISSEDSKELSALMDRTEQSYLKRKYNKLFYPKVKTMKDEIERFKRLKDDSIYYGKKLEDCLFHALNEVTCIVGKRTSEKLRQYLNQMLDINIEKTTANYDVN